MSTYQIGASSGSLVDVDTVLGIQPRSRYAPGAERFNDHGGEIVHVGYPRSVWVFAAVTVDDWTSLKSTYLSGTHSGEVYVQTRDDEDTWATYRALLRLPAADPLKRTSEHYLDVEIELVLLEEIP